MDRDELKHYFIHDLKWGWDYQARCVFDFLCRAADEARGGVILDAGAGYQRYKPFFKDAMYIAQEHPLAGARNKKIERYDILCDVKRIPLIDESVDVVLSTVSFEHLRYPQSFVDEAHRVLRRGGSLWIQAPFVYCEHETPYDFQRPTRYGLLRHFEDAGFEKTEVHPTSSSVFAALQWVEYAVKEELRRDRKRTKRRLLLKVINRITKLYLKAVGKILDKGPYPEATLPIGWISTGFKVGRSEKRILHWNRVGDFLRDHVQEDGSLDFNGDSLVCKNNEHE